MQTLENVGEALTYEFAEFWRVLDVDDETWCWRGGSGRRWRQRLQILPSMIGSIHGLHVPCSVKPLLTLETLEVAGAGLALCLSFEGEFLLEKGLPFLLTRAASGCHLATLTLLLVELCLLVDGTLLGVAGALCHEVVLGGLGGRRIGSSPLAAA